MIRKIVAISFRVEIPNLVRGKLMNLASRLLVIVAKCKIMDGLKWLFIFCYMAKIC